RTTFFICPQSHRLVCVGKRKDWLARITTGAQRSCAPWHLRVLLGRRRPLAYGQLPVCGHISERVDVTAGPADNDLVRAGGRPQAEVNPGIVGGHVTAVGEALAHLGSTVRGERDAGAERVPV